MLVFFLCLLTLSLNLIPLSKPYLMWKSSISLMLYLFIFFSWLFLSLIGTTSSFLCASTPASGASGANSGAMQNSLSATSPPLRNTSYTTLDQIGKGNFVTSSIYLKEWQPSTILIFIEFMQVTRWISPNGNLIFYIKIILKFLTFHESGKFKNIKILLRNLISSIKMDPKTFSKLFKSKDFHISLSKGSRPMTTSSHDKTTGVTPSMLSGMDYIRNPRLFKGMGFTLEERQFLGEFFMIFFLTFTLIPV